MTDKKDVCLNSEVEFTYLENNSAASFEWDFGADATPATADTEGPHKVTYSTEGTKTISLIVSGPAGSDTITRHDYIDVVSSIRVNILKEEMFFQQGQTVEISAYGGDSYSWSPSAIVDVDTGQTVLATPPEAGIHTLVVTGTQGQCSDTDTIMMTTTNKPPNDDMCDAMLITHGGWIGDFSNEFATDQEGEPAPEEGIAGTNDCYAPMKWCDEDGDQVNNSLWFYFYGPDEGLASVRTSGMDNQIAIYRADTCTQLVRDSIIAANDDYSRVPEVLSATIDEVPVIPGKKYFLQVDGSFGGAKGTFTLWFYAYPTPTEEIETYMPGETLLRVYPNPSQNIFNIRLVEAVSSDVEVLLYNLNGQLLMRKSFHDIHGELFTRLDVSRQASGVYHLRVIDGDRIIDKKLIKK
jgi:PKD repeat protein